METTISIIVIFVFGLAIGSFLNCLAYRLVRAEYSWLKKFLKGRSICPKCRRVLEPRDLLPVFSFLLLGGKCRHCKQKIHWQYPAVELLVGIVFVIIFFQTGASLPTMFGLGGDFNLLLWRNWLIVAMFVVVFLVDIKEMIIPDKVILPAGILILGMNLILGYGWQEMLISAVAISGFFLAQYLISGGKWIGFGDVKFGLVLGVALGYWGFLGLLLAYVIGGFLATILLLSGSKRIKSQIAFGPFLVIGGALALFWGPVIWQAYQKILLLI